MGRVRGVRGHRGRVYRCRGWRKRIRLSSPARTRDAACSLIHLLFWGQLVALLSKETSGRFADVRISFGIVTLSTSTWTAASGCPPLLEGSTPICWASMAPRKVSHTWCWGHGRFSASQQHRSHGILKSCSGSPRKERNNHSILRLVILKPQHLGVAWAAAHSAWDHRSQPSGSTSEVIRCLPTSRPTAIPHDAGKAG